ncbi:MAG: Flp pilus assembly complex ATPase component TadA [Chloroflexi bacterium]|nr:Flp pilus assembly complex ATPase component TadA [Chloroflexota bacterium]
MEERDPIQRGFALRRGVRDSFERPLVAEAANAELVERLAEEVRRRFVEASTSGRNGVSAEVVARELVENERLQRQLRNQPLDVEAVLSSVLQAVLGLGVIDEYRRMPGTTEIMVNGTRSAWVYQGDERLSIPPLTEEQLARTVELLLRESGESIGPLNPLVDARLSGSRMRINIVDKSINLYGYGVTLRVFPEQPLALENLVDRGTLSPQAAEFLLAMLQARANVVIAGGTSSGKTTTMCALTERIPAKERIVFIEAPSELPHTNPNHVVWETRRASAEGGRTVTVGDLIVNAMRARPDRIVVSEVRDGAALEMMEAMGTGHEGSLTTLHANDARDVFVRLLSLMYMGMRHDMPERMLYYKIYSAIDLVVFQREVLETLALPSMTEGWREGLGNSRSRMSRRVTEVHVVTNIDWSTGQIQTGELFLFDGERLRCQGGELSPRLVERCRRYGVEVPRLVRD